MTNFVSCNVAADALRSASQSGRLADRLEHGARALAALARSLTDAQWHTRIPGDGRTIGVVVHHVASTYPIEIQLAHKLAAGLPITGVSMSDIHVMNAGHAAEFAEVTKEAALELLEHNAADAAAAIRLLGDAELAQAAPVSLYADAPLTCQFLLEDHAVRHSYHHLGAIAQTVRSQNTRSTE